MRMGRDESRPKEANETSALITALVLEYRGLTEKEGKNYSESQTGNAGERPVEG